MDPNVLKSVNNLFNKQISRQLVFETNISGVQFIPEIIYIITWKNLKMSAFSSLVILFIRYKIIKM